LFEVLRSKAYGAARRFLYYYPDKRRAWVALCLKFCAAKLVGRRGSSYTITLINAAPRQKLTAAFICCKIQRTGSAILTRGVYEKAAHNNVAGGLITHILRVGGNTARGIANIAARGDYNSDAYTDADANINTDTDGDAGV